MSFTEAEITYLRSQRLCRIATVAPDGQPDVTPVGFDFDGSVFYVGGLNLTSSRKYRNVEDGHEKVALVVDDVASTDPWAPRFVRVYGSAELIEGAGEDGPAPSIRITPEISWSWNLEGRPFGHDETNPFGPRRTVHQPGGAPPVG